MQLVKFDRVETVCDAGLMLAISRLLNSTDEVLSKDAALCFTSVLHHDAAHRYLMKDSTQHSRDIIDQLMRCAVSCAANSSLRTRNRAKALENVIRSITRLASNAPLRRYMLSRSLELAVDTQKSAPQKRPRTHANTAHQQQQDHASVLDVVYESLALSGGSGRPMNPVKRVDGTSITHSSPITEPSPLLPGDHGAGLRAASAYLAPELFLDVLHLLSEITRVAPGVYAGACVCGF
jgi:hypothetical protein